MYTLSLWEGSVLFETKQEVCPSPSYEKKKTMDWTGLDWTGLKGFHGGLNCLRPPKCGDR